MINPFRIPFRRFEASRDRLVTIFVFGMFIFLFLFIFKPFGMSGMKAGQLFFVSLGFGLVTTFMLFIFKYLLEPIVVRNHWTLGKNLLWDLCIASGIGVANYFYICTIYKQVLVFKYLLLAIWAAILVGIIPVTISYFITYNRIYRNMLRNAAVNPGEAFPEPEIIIRAGNPKNELYLLARNIVYVCSNDNYVTVVHLKESSTVKHTMRGTLKSVETELCRDRRFFRCHKCYIVNLDHVTGTHGTASSMVLKINNSEVEIPVSRSLTGKAVKLLRKT